MKTGTPKPANAMSNAKPALTTKPRSFGPIAIIAIFVIAVMAAALLLTVPTTNAKPITLTKNTGQATHATTVVTLGTGTSDDSRAAQSFTTGTNTDGYTVSAIGIELATLSDATNAGTDLKLELYSHSGIKPGLGTVHPVPTQEPSLAPPATNSRRRQAQKPAQDC